MARASRPCPEPGCPSLQPCGAHTRKPWAGRGPRHARGYDAEYARLRRQVLHEESSCGLCGFPGREDDQVDHIVPLARGGTNVRANLRRTHRECNQKRRVPRSAVRGAVPRG